MKPFYKIALAALAVTAVLTAGFFLMETQPPGGGGAAPAPTLGGTPDPGDAPEPGGAPDPGSVEKLAPYAPAEEAPPSAEQPEALPSVPSGTSEAPEGEQQTGVPPAGETPAAAPAVPEPREGAAPNAPAQEPAPADDEPVFYCTVSVSCASLLDRLDLLDEDKLSLVPEDGWILKETTAAFYEGEYAFHVLQRTLKQEGIHMDFTKTTIYNSAYIKGIGNLYEFDAGELSGWMYRVNGEFPNYGSSRYELRDGDIAEWVYSCDLGRDVGETYLGDARN